jgi:hypothetical protein
MAKHEIFNLDCTVTLVSEYEIIYTLEELNKMQFDELVKTDWYFTRKVELNIDVPTDIINERLAIREKYDLLKLEL